MAFKINPIADVAQTASGVSGKLVSNQWKSISIQFDVANGDEESLWGAKGITFETTVDSVVVKGLKDATVINVSNNKQYTGSLTVLQAEIERWYASNPDLVGYSLVEFELFNIIVYYPNKDNDPANPTRHILKGCKFLNDPRNYSQTDGEPEVTLNLSISSIEYVGAKKEA